MSSDHCPHPPHPYNHVTTVVTMLTVTVSNVSLVISLVSFSHNELNELELCEQLKTCLLRHNERNCFRGASTVVSERTCSQPPILREEELSSFSQ